MNQQERMNHCARMNTYYRMKDKIELQQSEIERLKAEVAKWNPSKQDLEEEVDRLRDGLWEISKHHTCSLLHPLAPCGACKALDILGERKLPTDSKSQEGGGPK